jgi:hypothetical protein
MNALEDKKKRERDIVRFVYGSRAFFSVDQNERPDFLIRASAGERAFGVEVTEFFQSESQARLDRIPGYATDLLAGDGVRHKTDRQHLIVDKIDIKTETGELRHAGVPAIIQTVPSLNARAHLVAEIIRSKSQKLEDARGKLQHVNLIISDRTNLAGLIEPSSFYQYYCTEELVQALFASCFREVYYVTKFSSRQAFFPLKMVTTVAQLFFFDALVRESTPTEKAGSSELFMRFFASYMATITADEVRIRGEGLQTEVLYGDTGFLVDHEFKLQLRSYSDAPFGESNLVNPGLPPELGSAEFMDRMRKFQKEHIFETGIVFEAGSGAQFLPTSE